MSDDTAYIIWGKSTDTRTHIEWESEENMHLSCSLPFCECCHSSFACLTYTDRLVKGNTSTRNNALRQEQSVLTVMNDELRLATTGYFTLAEYRADARGKRWERVKRRQKKSCLHANGRRRRDRQSVLIIDHWRRWEEKGQGIMRETERRREGQEGESSIE